jgi:hypothetical protein
MLTNVPARAGSATAVAALSRERCTIETLFQVLVETLASEQPRRGYPKAALFAFCVALVAYNVLAVVRAALRAAHGRDVVEAGVSTYYLAHEIAGVYRGMMIALPAEQWEPLQQLTPARLAALLKDLASQARLPAYQRHARGPKKPRPERPHRKDQPHVSTARLIANRRNKK